MKTEANLNVPSAWIFPQKKHYFTMLKLTILAFIVAASAGFLFAQGWIFHGPGKPYDAKTPPPQSLTEAYGVAMDRVGAATNRLYCVSASCLENPPPYYAGWVFWFSNTNGERARVEVFFGSKEAFVPDAKSAELLK
jgi:hypothetical protein